MADWVETELKLGLPGEAAWRWVRERLGPGRVSMQTNHFFDDPDQSLRQQRIGVRLRAERHDSGETSHTLTVKGKLDDAPRGPITRRLELESAIESDSFAQALHSGIRLQEPIRAWREIAPADEVEREALADRKSVV